MGSWAAKKKGMPTRSCLMGPAVEAKELGNDRPPNKNQRKNDDKALILKSLQQPEAAKDPASATSINHPTSMFQLFGVYCDTIEYRTIPYYTALYYTIQHVGVYCKEAGCRILVFIGASRPYGLQFSNPKLPNYSRDPYCNLIAPLLRAFGSPGNVHRILKGRQSCHL